MMIVWQAATLPIAGGGDNVGGDGGVGPKPTPNPSNGGLVTYVIVAALAMLFLVFVLVCVCVFKNLEGSNHSDYSVYDEAVDSVAVVEEFTEVAETGGWDVAPADTLY